MVRGKTPADTSDKRLSRGLIKLYVQLVKNVCGNDIIDSKRIQEGKVRTWVYTANEAIIKNSLMLHAHKNHNNFNKFRGDFIEHFELCTKKDETENVFMF